MQPICRSQLGSAERCALAARRFIRAALILAYVARAVSAEVVPPGLSRVAHAATSPVRSHRAERTASKIRLESVP